VHEIINKKNQNKEMSIKKVNLSQSHTKNENINDLNAKAEEPQFQLVNVSFDDKQQTINVVKSKKYSPTKSLFNETGYKVTNKIASTMQGSVYNATNMDGEHCVVKRASTKLHNKHVALINNKMYAVKEDITNEAQIIEYLTSLNPPPGLTKFVLYFCDGHNHFLLTQHGGKCFFKHITMFHEKIRQGILKLKEWKQHIKILFKQMCIFINWLHNVGKVAHLDISLENMLIKGCVFKNGKFISHGQVNFIDFGLSERYPDKKSFDNCTKYVGKPNYQPPKVYYNLPFNAAKADVWSLGVVLFTMITGCSAYTIPTTKDDMFITLYAGYIIEWAKYNGKHKYFSKSVSDLLYHIFCDEEDRFTMKDIMKHKYLTK